MSLGEERVGNFDLQRHFGMGVKLYFPVLSGRIVHEATGHTRVWCAVVSHHEWQRHL